MCGRNTGIQVSQQFLENFSERIDLQWWHFVIPVAILLFFLMLSVSSVAYRAANSNPVDALKYK